MLTMARKRKPKTDQAQAVTPGSKPKKSTATGHYPLDLGPEMMAAVVAYADDTRRSVNNALGVLIEQALREAGYWPRPESEAEVG